MNAEHKRELVLTRSNTDHNAIIQSEKEDYQIFLVKVVWLIPQVRASDQNRLLILNLINTDKALTLTFRTWTLYLSLIHI